MSSISSTGGTSVTVSASVQLTTVKDHIDNAVGPVLDTSVNNVNGNAGAFLQIVASLAHACTKIRVADTTGQFIGVYTGGSGSEVLAFIINPGADEYVEMSIGAATRVSLRAMGSSAVNVGQICLEFAS